jgi:hypothetical protein
MLPQIPTDNLYKFKAISGVIVVMAALLFGGWVTWEREVASDRVDAQAKAFTEAFHAYRETLDGLMKLYSAKAPRDEIAGSKRQADSLGRIFNEHRAAVEASNDAMGTLNARTFVAEIICVVVALVGVNFSVNAFTKWQVRHQDYQDRLIVAQSERAELEVKELRARLAADGSPTDPAAVPPPSD